MVQKKAGFLKTTLLGGIVAVVPLAAVLYVLWTLLSSVIQVVEAMEGVLPFSPWINTVLVFALALAILLVICFLAGLILRTALGSSLKAWIDGLLVRFVPLYGMARKMTQRLAGADGQLFTPALIDLYGSEARALGWIVEELPEDRCAVFVPHTPAASFGQIYVVSHSATEPLDVPMMELMGPVTEWGAGIDRLFPSEETEETPEETLKRPQGTREK